MAEFTPQHNLYKYIENIQKVTGTSFWLIFFLSVVQSLSKPLNLSTNLNDLCNILSIVLLLTYFILDIIVDLIILPMAEDRRRDDYIDNSFGTNFSLNNSVGYYDNDDVQKGRYKAAVNLFQNSFTTYSSLKLLTIQKIIIPSAILIAVFVMAYFGFKEVPFSLSVLQILFSANLLGGLIKHLCLLSKTNEIVREWQTLFQNSDFKEQKDKYNTIIWRLWIRYEAILTKYPANIPNGFFDEHNNKITADWAALKEKYKI